LAPKQRSLNLFLYLFALALNTFASALKQESLNLFLNTFALALKQRSLNLFLYPFALAL
jgi:hypothetical protein